MKTTNLFTLVFLTASLAVSTFGLELSAQELNNNPELDEQVQTFLDENRRSWRDMNIPAIDGQILHDIIVENGYTRALEIGTSTGHSAIWIAWALSKTGGKLITIEIDEDRYNEALENFEEAGLSEFIDAKLANAHTLVPELEGPFDFVFSDADKDWYTNYFKAVDPNLVVGGCFTAHNIGRGRGGTTEFYEHISSLSNYETTLNSTGNGVSISYKRGE
ncbi:O-methyltransferase [Rhodohalobacter sulfatireducens]|uniref:Class I SAM-dependent methyltransferase n=1 Tax=Rhodohalobacter sulfatireducens TaxID=2911366 RepID=A0ABS9KDN5_9BACT|nr:class I SAM-dependent methyltransferase [Rhodohalobacter sulfatireducens]MCG2588950.1 class I SAM-dependent methyltransferase [Rhodohalobacter sulfatireducens]